MGFPQRLWTLANMSLVHFFGGLLRLWEIQERYHRNQFKDDSSLTGILVRCMFVHDREQSFKSQLKKITNTKNVLFLYRRRLLIIIRE